VVDRVGLLTVIASRASLSAIQVTQFNKQLDKALAIALAELALEDARLLSPPERGELEAALRDILTLPELKKVSKRWEPQRKIDPDVSQTEITDGLAELLHTKREPYAPCTRTLAQARALGEREKADLRHSLRLAPAADLKKLARYWDKANGALAAAVRARLEKELLSLLDGKSEPMKG
jgi:hypothetical protein